MEEGSLRCDVNISVKKKNEDFGTRCEIKNVNSIKSIGQAIEHEFHRQVEIIESGDKVQQETRLFDEKKGETRPMRTKEEAHDYRYFPDPDLPPLEISSDLIGEIKKNLPELPDVKKKKLIDGYGLSSYESSILISDKNNVDFFEAVINENNQRNPKVVVNWIIGDLFSLLKKNNLDIKKSPVKPSDLGELIDLIENSTISGKLAKTVFDEMFYNRKKPKKIIKQKGLIQITDSGEIENVITKVLSQNVDKVNEYKSGKEKLYGYFIGQIMQETKGKANPKLVNEILKKKLAK